MSESFQIPAFIAAMAIGFVCLVLPARRGMPARPVATAMAAVCLAGSLWLLTVQPGRSVAYAVLSPLCLLLSLGYAAAALSGKPLLESLYKGAGSILARRYGYIDRWLDTTEKISSRTDPAEIKSFLAEICSETVCSSAVYVWLFEGSSGTFTANTIKMEPAIRRIRPGHALLEHAKATGGAPFFINDMARDEETDVLVRGLGAVVCAPLICHREISGIMLLGRKRGRTVYTEYDLRLLRAITTQAAVQLKNIRLSSDLFDMKESDQFNRMSSFVAHDLKNLTNSLSLLAHNAKRSISDPAFQREALKAMEATASKMRALAGKMACGSSGLELNRSYADLREVLWRAAQLATPTAQARLKVEQGGPFFCWIDEELVETVFLNMLANASEATRDGDEISVSFEQSMDFISVVIMDNGTGIPRPYLENWLFRPFRTTKKDGFGIGLYQAKTVIEAHGGSIEVESEEGKGTRFTLKLPAQAMSAGAGDVSLAG